METNPEQKKPAKSIAHERKMTFYPGKRYKSLIVAAATVNNVTVSEQISMIISRYFDTLQPIELKPITERAELFNKFPRYLEAVKQIKLIPLRQIITIETGAVLNDINVLERCPICSKASKHGDYAFHVNGETFRCVICGANGAGVEFIMKLHRLKVMAAIQYIVEKYLS